MYSRGLIRTKSVVKFSVIWGWIMPALFVGVIAAADVSVYTREPSKCQSSDVAEVIAT